MESRAANEVRCNVQGRVPDALSCPRQSVGKIPRQAVCRESETATDKGERRKAKEMRQNMTGHGSSAYDRIRGDKEERKGEGERAEGGKRQLFEHSRAVHTEYEYGRGRNAAQRPTLAS